MSERKAWKKPKFRSGSCSHNASHYSRRHFQSIITSAHITAELTMPGLQTDDEMKDEKLKAALWYSIGQTVDGVGLEQDLNATPHFIGGLSEMVWGQIETVARDIEAFAKHSGRSTISTKDVILLSRRNEGLQELLNSQAKAVREKDTVTEGS